MTCLGAVDITAEAAQNFAMSYRLGKRNQKAADFLLRGKGCVVCAEAVMPDSGGHCKCKNGRHGPYEIHGRQYFKLGDGATQEEQDWLRGLH